MVYINPKESDVIQDKLVQWINDNLPDPYVQAKKDKRDNLAYGEDFKLIGIMPKVHVAAGDIESERMTAGPKTSYLEEETHTFLIYYYCQLDHRFKFDDGKVLENERQVRRFLTLIKTKMKANLDDFGEYFHKPSFGTIPMPKLTKTNSVWYSMMPLTVVTFRR